MNKRKTENFGSNYSYKFSYKYQTVVFKSEKHLIRKKKNDSSH